MKPQVIGLGALSVDELLYLPAFPPPDGKVEVAYARRECGGLAGTALVAAARLGVRTAYAGLLGADANSRFAERDLMAEGVDTSEAVRADDASPVEAHILVD